MGRPPGHIFRTGLSFGLSLVALGLLAGCSDWPHFNYEPSPVSYQTELEAEGEEQVQNLGILYGDVLVSGRIEDSAYVPGASNLYGLPGWYAGDMDWFQFTLRDPRDARLELSWSDAEADLDLYFFVASSSTGEIDTLVAYRNDSGSGPESLGVAGLVPDTIYVIAVAGFEGDAVDYELSIELGR